jgi:hypothetical protein
MPTAFGTLDEPHAWLIRGLVEYGWTDVSRNGGYVPPGHFGGLDLSRLSETEGREGIVLEVPAMLNGQRFDEDGTYHFQALVIRSADTGQLAIAVRCPEANYIQEFAYDASNPTWAAGFVHQALTQYVPEFVQWRSRGGEVTWAQRQGIVELDGESCSGPLAGFVSQSIRAGRAFDRGPAEGWWMGAHSPLSQPGDTVATGPAIPGILRQASPGPAGAPQGWPPVNPSASPVARGPGTPAVPGFIGGGPIAQAGTGLAYSGKSLVNQRKLLAEKPGTALLVTSALGGIQGLFWFFNALSIIVMYRDLVEKGEGAAEMSAMALSIFLAMVLVPASAVAGFGAWQYRKGEQHPTGWIAIGYAMLVPVCCLPGLLVGGWAIKTWQDPVFKQK